jgi:hypothetical protein
MKAVPQKQMHTHDTGTVPGWLSDPKPPKADLERPKRNESTRAVPVHEDTADDEPGYGHGV